MRLAQNCPPEGPVRVHLAYGSISISSVIVVTNSCLWESVSVITLFPFASFQRLQQHL